jgi:DNA mismatch endonuclease (patch repair protein)
MDKFSAEKRSEIMSKIRSKNTVPELKLFAILDGLGVAYQKHSEHLPGKPDAVVLELNLAIFMHGCYWHKCSKCYKEPKSNKDFWVPKIARNVERDEERIKALNKRGYRVLRIWEHQLRKREIASLEEKLTEFLKSLGWNGGGSVGPTV